MIVIAGKVAVRPEKRDAAIEAALQMSEATEAEAGCLAYRFYADLRDPNIFFLFEEWENEEALTRHFKTDHMRVFQQKLPEVMAGKPVIKRYTVQTVAPL